MDNDKRKVINLIAICGKSGSGKNYIEKEINKSSINGYKFIKLKQVTTRELRDDDIKNDYYIKVTNSEYYKLIEDNKFINTTTIEYYDKNNKLDYVDKYGTLIDENKFKNADSKTYFTMIVNAKAIMNLFNYLSIHSYNFNCSFNVIILYIDNKNPVLSERKNRFSIFRDQEVNDLKYAIYNHIKNGNIKLYNVFKINNHSDNYVNPNDIVKFIINRNTSYGNINNFNCIDYFM